MKSFHTRDFLMLSDNSEDTICLFIVSPGEYTKDNVCQHIELTLSEAISFSKEIENIVNKKKIVNKQINNEVLERSTNPATHDLDCSCNLCCKNNWYVGTFGLTYNGINS